MIEYRKSEIECWYFLFDITRNNTLEIWILTGSFEAEKELHVFTYSNQGTLVNIMDAPGDYSGFYLGGDYIIQWKTHMGYEAWIKYYYMNNQMCSDVIYENQDTIDYTSPSEPYIELIPWELIL